MLSKPKISVVTPVYNREDVIRHCIHGILDQSFQDWELILVDDGSTDNTQVECERFAIGDKRVKYFKIPHSGMIGHVRNYGNQKAQGELIVVQDSDDVSLPDRLQVLWDEYQKTNSDVLYHSVYQCFPFEKYQVTLRQFKSPGAYDLDKLLHTQYIPAQLATKREVALRIPYDVKIHVSDDWMWLLELALNKCRFHFIDQALYEYFHSPDSANVLGERDGRRALDMKHIMNKLKTKYKIDVIKADTINEKGKITKTQYSDDSGDQAASHQA